MTGKDWVHILAVTLFVILNMVLALLTVRTVEAMMSNKICVAED